MKKSRIINTQKAKEQAEKLIALIEKGPNSR